MSCFQALEINLSSLNSLQYIFRNLGNFNVVEILINLSTLMTTIFKLKSHFEAYKNTEMPQKSKDSHYLKY